MLAWRFKFDCFLSHCATIGLNQPGRKILGKTSLFVKPLDPNENQIWEKLVFEHGSLFNTLRWTDQFTPNLYRLGLYDSANSLLGGFCVWEQRKFGLRILRNPPLTPYVGPFFKYRATNAAAKTEERRRVAEAMATWLDQENPAVVALSLAPNHTDSLPFYWRGFKVTPRFTYLMDLARKENALIQSMSTKMRHHIRKAKKDQLKVVETGDSSMVRGFVLRSFARQNKRLDEKQIESVFAAYPPGFNSYCMVTLFADEPVAGTYVVYDNHSGYYLLGGHSDQTHHGAGPLAIWMSIQRAIQLGLSIFDFEGSIIPPIERYFRGFGGRLTPYYGIYKAWIPLEIVLKFFRRSLF